jgi:hypothetical protein
MHWNVFVGVKLVGIAALTSPPRFPLLILLILVFLFLFVYVISRFVQRERAAIQRRRSQAAALGFQPARYNRTITEPILALYRRSAEQRLALRNLFFQRSLDGDLYLFDVWDPDSQSNSQLIGSGVALHSPDANFPRFAIYPMAEGSGLKARLSNRLLTWALGHGRKVRLTGVPDFDERFTVVANAEGEESILRSILTIEVRRRLIGLPSIQVAADGDMMAVSNQKINSAPDESKSGLIRELIETIGYLSEEFRQA